MAGPGGETPRIMTVETSVASLRVIVRGEGPTVVMVPSLGRDVEDFDELAETLAHDGYRTAALSPRGIGGSTGPLEGLTLRDLAGDVAAVIDALDAVSGASDRPRLRQSGGALHRCASFPDSVRSVTILAAGGKFLRGARGVPPLRQLPRRRTFGQRGPRRDQAGALCGGQRSLALAEGMVAGGGAGAIERRPQRGPRGVVGGRPSAAPHYPGPGGCHRAGCQWPSTGRGAGGPGQARRARQRRPRTAAGAA